MSFSLQARTEIFELPHPGGNGHFQISVSRLADLAEGRQDVPILFVLDADTSFALAAEIARFRNFGGVLPTAMVVGIGYGATFADFARMRTGDLTPPLSEAGKAALGDMASLIGDQDGGAEAFLAFLADTLVPEILRRYPEASATDHALYGHSLAGLFVAYALLARPDAFSTFLSISPSLWWDGFAVLGRLPDFTRRLAGLDRLPHVLVGVGSKEQDLPTRVPGMLSMSLEDLQAIVARSRMVDAAAEFADALREAGLERVEHVAFAGEDHSSVVPAALMRGLVFAVPGPE